GGKPTTDLMGWAGQSCANAGAARTSRDTSREARRGMERPFGAMGNRTRAPAAQSRGAPKASFRKSERCIRAPGLGRRGAHGDNRWLGGSMEKQTFDVVVAGCGVAGLSAAVAAAEGGARAAVLERSTREERGGQSRYT